MKTDTFDNYFILNQNLRACPYWSGYPLQVLAHTSLRAFRSYPSRIYTKIR